jgi:hypothetical protein
LAENSDRNIGPLSCVSYKDPLFQSAPRHGSAYLSESLDSSRLEPEQARAKESDDENLKTSDDFGNFIKFR